MKNKALKIRVALIGNFPLRTDNIKGGVEAVFVYLVEALRNFKELDIHVITLNSKQKKRLYLESDGYHLHILPAQSLGFPSFFIFDFNNIKKCLNEIKPDIVHSQGAGHKGYAAIKSGYPTLITFHGMLGEDAKYFNKVTDKIRLKLHSLIFETYCAKNSTHAILISSYVKKYFGKKLRAKTYLIPNPVKKDFFNLSPYEETGRVLFAGQIIPRKGIEDLLKALVMIKNKVKIKVILAGSLDESIYFNKIKKYIINNKLSKFVTFLGTLDENSILDEFRRCCLLVLPSYQETAPMVIQQAMAAGKPVIATKICGIPYQVDDGVTGLLYETGDATALSKHLLRLLNENELRKKMGKKGKKKAYKYFNANAVAADTLKVYNQMKNKMSI